MLTYTAFCHLATWSPHSLILPEGMSRYNSRKQTVCKISTLQSCLLQTLELPYVTMVSNGVMQHCGPKYFWALGLIELFTQQAFLLSTY